MSEKLLDIFERRTVESMLFAAYALFKEAEQKFGAGEARRIFSYVSSELSDNEVRELKNLALLRSVAELEATGALNVAELARQLVAENERAVRAGNPAPNGPRGTTNLMTMDKHLRTLIEQRNEGLANGTWVRLGKTCWPKHLSVRILDIVRD